MAIEASRTFRTRTIIVNVLKNGNWEVTPVEKTLKAKIAESVITLAIGTIALGFIEGNLWSIMKEYGAKLLDEIHHVVPEPDPDTHKKTMEK